MYEIWAPRIPRSEATGSFGASVQTCWLPGLLVLRVLPGALYQSKALWPFGPQDKINANRHQLCMRRCGNTCKMCCGTPEDVSRLPAHIRNPLAFASAGGQMHVARRTWQTWYVDLRSVHETRAPLGAALPADQPFVCDGPQGIVGCEAGFLAFFSLACQPVISDPGPNLL